MKSLSGKFVAITGASSGIGRALAHAFARHGCPLSLSDINERGLQDTVAELASYGVKTPAQAAAVIVAGVRANKRRVLIGADARLFDWFARLMRAFYQRIFTAAVRMRSRKANL